MVQREANHSLNIPVQSNQFYRMRMESGTIRQQIKESRMDYMDISQLAMLRRHCGQDSRNLQRSG